MIKVRIDEDTFLVADFKGTLSPAEEAVTAYRLAGNNSGSIATVLDKSVETVRGQLKKAYLKMKVDGVDDPITLLSVKAFKQGWISFALLLVALTTSIVPTPRDSARVSAKTANSRNYRDDFGGLPA